VTWPGRPWCTSGRLGDEPSGLERRWPRTTQDPGLGEGASRFLHRGPGLGKGMSPFLHRGPGLGEGTSRSLHRDQRTHRRLRIWECKNSRMPSQGTSRKAKQGESKHTRAETHRSRHNNFHTQAETRRSSNNCFHVDLHILAMLENN